MSPLPPTPSESNWAAEILEAAKEEFWGEIGISEPGTPGTWANGAVTGGSAGAVVISRRPARIQHLGLPLEIADGNGWGTKRRIRIQFEILETDGPIRKGLTVTVYNGGNDPSLTSYKFQVASAVNSDHAALRTVECVSEMSPS